MTQGGGRGFGKVSRDIFSKIFESFLAFSKVVKVIFGKIKIISHHTGGGGGYGPMSQNDTGAHGEWGSKICQKSVTYCLNGPFSVNFLALDLKFGTINLVLITI